VDLRENGKVFLLFYLSGFFVGIIFANTISKELILSMGIFDENFLNQYFHIDLNESQYFIYLLKTRLIPMLFLVLVGTTKFRKIMVSLMVIWTGLLNGIVISAGVLCCGFLGAVLVMCSLLPHMLFYFVGYGALLWNIYRYPKLQLNIMKLMLIFMVVTIGILTECYLNPSLVQMFIKTI
jgi:hypothetical protein